MLALALVLLLAPRAALPSPRSGGVILLDPPNSSSTARHCLTRIREELVAGGFEVVLVDPGPRLDPVSIASFMERQQAAVATIALVGDPDAPGAELWIVDRVGPVPEVRRIPAPTDRDRLPEVFAIRTFEVLKASALKALVEATHRTEPASAPPTPPAAPALPRSTPVATRDDGATNAVATRGGLLGIETGIAMLDDVGRLGPAAVPVARVRALLGDVMFVRVTLAGLGSRPRLSSTVGSVSVAQAIVLAELGARLRPGRRWRPTLGLGAGTFYVQTDGVGVWPAEGLQQQRWTGAVDGTAGMELRATAALALAVEIHALLALPHPTVQFLGREAATLGVPTLMASLTMIAWL